MTKETPPDAANGASGEAPFPEVKAAADSAAADPSLRPGKLAKAGEDPEFPRGTWEEAFRGEVNKNMAADRQMRWCAFAGTCVIAVFFFILLISIFCNIVFGNYFFKVEAAAVNGMQWHILVFLGIVLVLLAAIPLSLSLAMVKMITNKDSDEIEVKTATMEFGKIIYELVKGFISKHGG